MKGAYEILSDLGRRGICYTMARPGIMKVIGYAVSALGVGSLLVTPHDWNTLRTIEGGIAVAGAAAALPTGQIDNIGPEFDSGLGSYC